MRSQYIIILSIFSTLILSMLFLAYIENHQRESQENFWSISFVSPFNDINSFVIDNRTQEETTFFYEINTNDNATIGSGTVTLAPKEHTLIETSEEQNITPLSITVHTDNSKKKIEKK